jgi:RNA:NAD 2'-phosphotransferase (TPT1/KptA family)
MAPRASCFVRISDTDLSRAVSHALRHAAPQTWAPIEADGLLPMGRRFVHLSVDRETIRRSDVARAPVNPWAP